jgi:hypothetical protein
VAAAVLPSLRVRGGSGRMGVSNRRPKHRICNNTNEQEDGDHDRRNDVFHDGRSDRRHELLPNFGDGVKDQAAAWA